MKDSGNSPAVAPLTPSLIRERLARVIDPELGVNIVKLGLIYDVQIHATAPKVEIVMTLTTPGCPLAGVFDAMVRDALFGLPEVDVDHDVSVRLTFDPPWVPDMMDAEAKAELGFD